MRAFVTEQIMRRSRGRLADPRHTGVFAVGHVPAARESSWHAAVLALGARAVLSHMAAAVLWGMVRANGDHRGDGPDAPRGT